MSSPKILNLETLRWSRWARREGIEVEAKDPARKLGSEICGLRIERLMPGKQASELHRHHFQEEMFLILKGQGILRHGDLRVPVQPGDFILYRAGDETPHTFVNTGDEPLELLATGNRAAHEVCEYPEEGTVFVEALGAELVHRPVPGSAERVQAWFAAGQDTDEER